MTDTVQPTEQPVHGWAILIGLTISRTIAELHGGTLTVASRAGEGSTFQLTLPSMTRLLLHLD